MTRSPADSLDSEKRTGCRIGQREPGSPGRERTEDSSNHPALSSLRKGPNGVSQVLPHFEGECLDCWFGLALSHLPSTRARGLNPQFPPPGTRDGYPSSWEIARHL